MQYTARAQKVPLTAPDRRHPGASFETVLYPSDPADPADISLQKTVSKYGKFDMGYAFDKYSVQAVAWLFSKKSGLFFGISRFKKIDTVT